MADILTLQARISEAEQARHDLMCGKRPKDVRYSDGGGASFSEMSLAQIDSYLTTLRQELYQAQSGRSRRPITFEFGR